ncbi:penicillin-binding protein 1C [Flavihumibacter solisilvae]|uniref:peptidoglycan glycosyltransferase n=1 Tax=Flavihumibacter solisilvae TaxID=1349421 RepID=A0A0C1J0I8_9BACT|nr:penicillin-binding protein 1C [Flavihumibacter solisilvae]KIC96284.1 glycosyl transferase [Flavihumibacter solisilvae]
MKKLIAIGSLLVVMVALHFIFPVPLKVEYSTVITDEKDAVLNAYLTSQQKWRMKTELNEISPLLQKAIVHKEDKWFYFHPGINPFAMARALFNNVFSLERTSGASTITMQVARALEPRPRNIWSKIIEVFRAFQLEIALSKQEILQLYLNLVPYGGNIEGVKSAAVIYFRKSPDHLSLAEITALSVIPNRPSYLVMGRSNDAIVRERNKWLMRFLADGLFSTTEIRDALEEPLTAVRNTVPHEIPHLAVKLKQSGQANIPTFIRLDTQLKTEKLVSDYVRSKKALGIHNAAVVIIDNRTNRVITYVGSADFNDSTDGGQVNGAAAVRQPGSTLKPLVYGLAIDAGLLTPKTIMTDVAINYNGYAPENYDRQFNGYVTMEYALDHSLNIPAVKCLRSVGKDHFTSVLSGLGFRQVKADRGKLGLSMILGGCGATLEELTALFSMFAHEGIFMQPDFMDGHPQNKSHRVLSPAASFMISDVLSKINRPDFPLSWQSTEKMPRIAWKTGTSYGRRDAWSIGYNKHFTIGVWVGNFSGRGVPSLSGAEIATPLLFRIFNSVDYNSEKDWFTQPADCNNRFVCSASGLPPGEFCTEQVNDYFIPMYSSTAKCDHMKEVVVSPDGKISYCINCMPESGYRKMLLPAYAPEMLAWMEEQQIVHNNIPPHNSRCEKIFREGAPTITAPQNNAEYLIDRNHREPLQLACNAGTEVERVHWYVNDRYYKTAGARQKIFFIPEEGQVKITCSDDRGRNRDVRIVVKYY